METVSRFIDNEALSGTESRPSFPCSSVSCISRGGHVQTPPLWCKLILGEVHSRSWETATQHVQFKQKCCKEKRKWAHNWSRSYNKLYLRSFHLRNPLVCVPMLVLPFNPLTATMCRTIIHHRFMLIQSTWTLFHLSAGFYLLLADSYSSRGPTACRIHPLIAPLQRESRTRAARGACVFVSHRYRSVRAYVRVREETDLTACVDTRETANTVCVCNSSQCVFLITSQLPLLPSVQLLKKTQKTKKLKTPSLPLCNH